MNVLGGYISLNALILFANLLALFCILVLIFKLLMELRFYLKRIKLIVKIKRVCKEKNYKLIKTSAFSLFKGRKLKDECDFYIKTEKELLSVKLLGTHRKGKVLVFFMDEYCFRLYTRCRYSRSLMGEPTFSDGIKRKTPKINFEYGLNFENDLPLRKILLLNPAPLRVETSSNEYNGKGTEYCDTDRIFDFYIYGGHSFVKSLNEGFDFEKSDRIFEER